MFRNLHRLAIALAVATLFYAASTRQASAVGPIPNTCCTFTYDVIDLPLSCFPLKPMTCWTYGTQADVIPGNGIHTVAIGGGPCPPAQAEFFWASLNAGFTKAWFNAPLSFHTNCGCISVRIGRDPNTNCIIVHMRPC